MRGIALVIGAVRVILKHLNELPDGPEVRALRETAFGCIEEVAMWNASKPSAEMREATMKRVLALHVAANRLDLEGPSVDLQAQPTAPLPGARHGHPRRSARSSAETASRRGEQERAVSIELESGPGQLDWPSPGT